MFSFSFSQGPPPPIHHYYSSIENTKQRMREWQRGPSANARNRKRTTIKYKGAFDDFERR
jgi:hypothetical protein